MKVDLGIWSKLTGAVIFLLLLAGIGLVVVWYLPQIRQNEHMRAEILRLDTQIQQEEEAARKLKASIDALHHDPKTVERLAREKLGYAKPGETVIRFEEPVTNGGTFH
ncbi:MAG TPA: septum formation initiator family protein [Verrucomicrobiae bacterium]|nr:septum formation initiator family protein [Verrucomicrobiae bacterium]